MKRVSKVISIMLALLMVTSLFAACGAEKQEPNAASTQESTPADSTALETKSSEPVVLTVFDEGGASLMFGQDDPIWENNPVAKKILEVTNVKLKLEFPTGDGKEKLNLLLAGGDYPDMLVFSDETILNKVITEKIAVPIDPMLGQYGPNILQSYGNILDMLKSSDGHNYYLSRGYGSVEPGQDLPGFGSCFSIRRDVYEGIGSPKIETTDDIYNILKQLADKYPENYAGEKVWPISGFKQTWQNTMQIILDGAGMYDSKWYINNNELKYWVRAPQALTAVKFFNKLTREGLMDPEAFTKDRAAWEKTKLQTARTLSLLGGWWMNWTVQNDYKAAGIAGAEKMDFVQFPFSVPGGQRPNLVMINKKGGGSTVITNKCKNPEAAVKFLDYLSSHDGNFTVQNGAEGIMWEMKDGKPVIKPEFLARWQANEADEKFSPETGLRLYHHFVGTDVGKTKWGTYWILKDDPAATNDTRAKWRDDQLGKYWYDVSVVSGLFAQASEDITNIFTLVEERFNNQFYACILAKTEADCEAEFNKYVKGLEDAGLAKVEEYANSVYQENIKAAGN